MLKPLIGMTCYAHPFHHLVKWTNQFVELVPAVLRLDHVRPFRREREAKVGRLKKYIFILLAARSHQASGIWAMI